MRPDFDPVLFRQPHRLVHDRGVRGVKAARNIGEIDVRHQRCIIAEPIKPETFAHIAVDCHAHDCELMFVIRCADPVSAYRSRTGRGYQYRLERRNEPSPFAPRRYGAIDLLGRFDNVDPRKRCGQGRAGALPGAGRA